MKTAIKKKLVKLTSRKSFQKIMHKLYLFGLTGMNYGNANTLSIEETGEKFVISYIGRQLQQQNEIIFFDAGANAGDYSKMVSKILKTDCLKIYAFEPAVYTFSLLTKNISSLVNAELFNFGLSDKNEMLTIYSNFEASGAATIYSNALENYASNKKLSEQIEVKTLDDFCTEKQIQHIDFLKIDVEGHELNVLLGGQHLLENKRIKFIQFEFGPFNVYSRTFFKDFWDLLYQRYKIYRIISNGLLEITSYTENFEIFRTVNFLAELRTT